MVPSIATCWVIAGSALASVMVPLTEKLMSVAAPLAASAEAMAARSDPDPESDKVVTANIWVVCRICPVP